MPDNNGRPNHIEDALVSMHDGQWFGWTDSKNKIYTNLKLSDFKKIKGNRIENKKKRLLLIFFIYLLFL